MWFVAGRAAFKTNRRVIENEGPALVAMALQAARLVGGNGLHRARQNAPVRIVAIDARYRAFRNLVPMRTLKRRPFRQVACGAGGVHGCPPARDQFFGRLVNRVAGDAAHLIARMPALDASDVRGLVAMAAQAACIGLRHG